MAIICGLPGSGKTTLAKRLAEERQALRLCPDEWIRALGLDAWDEGARDRVEKLQLSIAEPVLSGGGSVVIEWGTWGRIERDQLLESGRSLGVSVELYYLDAPVEELHRRLVARGTENPLITLEQLVEWSASFERPTESEGQAYDSYTENLS